MLIAVAMLTILIIAGAVVAYVAFPHRGQRMPVVPWLGDAMGKAVESLPTQAEPEDFYESVPRESR
ncbi:MAG: hypothetical protein U0R80_10790 [Nocardioidaceae bacterium]